MMERRLAKVAVSFGLLREIVTQGRVIRPCVVTTGVPEDATYIGSTFDDRRMDAYLIFAHPSFELLQDGQEIPYLTVVHKSYFNPEADALYRAQMEQDANA